jgi:hypothetical protein
MRARGLVEAIDNSCGPDASTPELVRSALPEQGGIPNTYARAVHVDRPVSWGRSLREQVDRDCSSDIWITAGKINVDMIYVSRVVCRRSITSSERGSCSARTERQR